MVCGTCGAVVPDGSQFCNRCGQLVSGQAGSQGATVPTVRSYAGSYTPPLPDAPTSGKALASMISGIFGFILFVPAIPAVVLGHMSRSEIQKSNGRLKGDGMAVAGMVMGYLVLAMIPVILILAAIAIPNLLRARMAANEASAVGSLRIINTAQISYQAANPTIGFACSFATLGGRGASGSPALALPIDGELASGQKNGYRFSLRNCVNTETEHRYAIVAYPLVRNQTGVRTFCSDETAVIKSIPGGSGEKCLKDGSPL
jgi:type IV pilus assembly protein PilA